MNHKTMFAALTHILTQTGDLCSLFKVEVIEDEDFAREERERIMASLPEEQQKCIIEYFEEDAEHDTTLQVTGRGETHLGSIFVVYDDKGCAVSVYAISY